MKIERLSDNQIKCTLTRQDLEERKMRLSELVYGSEKAQELFKDMLHMAAIECGFDGEEMPIMVEAIPSSKGSLVLIITKVDSPEELDTRFSRFTPAPEKNNDNSNAFSEEALQGIDSDREAVNELFDTTGEHKGKSKKNSDKKSGEDNQAEATKYRAFRFESIEHLGQFANAVNGSYRGKSSLYKDNSSGKYYLVLFVKGNTAKNFNLICNVASEYSSVLKLTSIMFYNEHYKLIAKDDAIERLALML